MKKVLESLRSGLIVSCQAEPGDPFNEPEKVALFAKAAIMGGAVGIRSEGLDKIVQIKKQVIIPVIGLIKSQFEDGFVKITGSFGDVESLLEAGCDIISIDGTMRIREGLCGPEFIALVKEKYNCTVMADISTFEEGIACMNAGADCISTTLSGYTPYTITGSELPDSELVCQLVKEISIPVFAEGRINTPQLAKQMFENGAWAVVVGTAITRPRVITKWFVDKINE